MYIPEKQIRTRFSKEDDILLISLVNEYGIGNWDFIREKFVNKASNQCRDRWFRYLDPKIKKSPWTTEEDSLLQKAFEEFGSNWSGIASKYFPDRSDISLRNRFVSLKQKKQKSKLNDLKFDERLINLSKLYFHNEESNDSFDFEFMRCLYMC
jgi:myb proto-oncogene protein